MKKNIYIFSIFNWNSDLMHREHQLALSFNRLGYKVFFVERKWLGISGFTKKIREEGGIKIISLLALPYLRGRFKFIFNFNDWLLKKQINFLDKNSVALVSGPLWGRAIAPGTKKIIYDMSDDTLLFAKNNKWKNILAEYEKDLINLADLTVVTSKNLLPKVPRGKKSELIENGVDIKSLAVSEPILKKEYSGKLVGFIGGIYEWVDLDLVTTALEELNNVNFIFIGPTNQKSNLEAISRKYSNFRYLGSKSWKEIGNYFASLDVGIVPFVSEKQYPRLSSVNSNKLFQYAYFGYPIVTTCFNQAVELADILYVSKDKKEFIKNLKEALAENESKLREKRRNFARGHTWDHKAKAILESIHE